MTVVSIIGVSLAVLGALQPAGREVMARRVAGVGLLLIALQTLADLSRAS